ncbi:MAG: catalase, partial [Planctomycetota bacterium]|nr:catalase [Planctomycetota bacterium]
MGEKANSGSGNSPAVPEAKAEISSGVPPGEESGGRDGDRPADPGTETDPKGEPLDRREQAELDRLQTRDGEVRRHEQAHKAAGGRYAGAISYEYSRGPDGKRYA